MSAIKCHYEEQITENPQNGATDDYDYQYEEYMLNQKPDLFEEELPSCVRNMYR
jgi:hypothetical protein